MIGAAISMLGSLAGIHGWFTGLRAGAVNERILEEMLGLRSSVERLSEHVLYIESVNEVRDITRRRQQRLDDKQMLSELLTPLQESLDEDILSTAVVMTPKRLHQALSRDPWEVLIEIRPAGRSKKPANPDMVPIIFSDSSQAYIGWQTKGALPILFDFEYKPNAHLYLPLRDPSPVPDKKDAAPDTGASRRSTISRDRVSPKTAGKDATVTNRPTIDRSVEEAPDRRPQRVSAERPGASVNRTSLLFIRAAKISLSILLALDLFVPDPFGVVDELILGLATGVAFWWENRAGVKQLE